MASLRTAEIERIKFSFSMYEENDKVDSIYMALLLRGMNYNPSLKQLEQLGVKQKKGERLFTIEEVMEICTEFKNKIKSFGTETDFAEVLSMMDKDNNGKVALTEIASMLSTLGEPLDADEMDEVMADCMPPEDDEGLVDFMPFLKALCSAR